MVLGVAFTLCALIAFATELDIEQGETTIDVHRTTSTVIDSERPQNEVDLGEELDGVGERRKRIAKHSKRIAMHTRSIAKHKKIIAEHMRRIATHPKRIAKHGNQSQGKEKTSTGTEKASPTMAKASPSAGNKASQNLLGDSDKSTALDGDVHRTTIDSAQKQHRRKEIGLGTKKSMGDKKRQKFVQTFEKLCKKVKKTKKKIRNNEEKATPRKDLPFSQWSSKAPKLLASGHGHGHGCRTGTTVIPVKGGAKGKSVSNHYTCTRLATFICNHPYSSE